MFATLYFATNHNGHLIINLTPAFDTVVKEALEYSMQTSNIATIYKTQFPIILQSDPEFQNGFLNPDNTTLFNLVHSVNCIDYKKLYAHTSRTLECKRGSEEPITEPSTKKFKLIPALTYDGVTFSDGTELHFTIDGAYDLEDRYLDARIKNLRGLTLRIPTSRYDDEGSSYINFPKRTITVRDFIHRIHKTYRQRFLLQGMGQLLEYQSYRNGVLNLAA